ncbi:MAG: response regulator [bacterium]|nr:response regulator [bacterium]
MVDFPEAASTTLPGYAEDMMERTDILIADDDEMIRIILRGLFKKLYSRRLETGQLRLRTAVNGREAVDMASAEPPDLILMDVQMPQLDGIEVFYELKRLLGRRCPNIYFISGYEKSGEIGERIAPAPFTKILTVCSGSELETVV